MSYAELACAIPKAGGAFDYTRRGLGADWAFVAGMAQWITFICAPPAIAFGIGTYLNLLFPSTDPIYFSIFVYLLFTGLNIYGVHAAAKVELIITCMAIAGIILFSALAAPHFSSEAFLKNAQPQGWSGIFASIPFAIWFFLGIEGLANVAEECKHPQKDISVAFNSSMLTLIVLCILVFVFSTGIGGWEKVVYVDGQVTDSPLPPALALIYGKDNLFYTLVTIFGTFGLLASFHGLLLSAGRAGYEMGQKKYLPAFMGKLHPKFQTPYTALMCNLIIGFLFLVSGKTADIIILSVFGALTAYILSMLALIRFRVKDPHAPRPFRVPLYPILPIAAIVLSTISLVSMLYYNTLHGLYYFLFVGICFVAYATLKPNS